MLYRVHLAWAECELTTLVVIDELLMNFCYTENIYVKSTTSNVILELIKYAVFKRYMIINNKYW